MSIMVFAVAIVVAFFFFIGMYNKMIQLRNYTKEAFSTMDVCMKKRWDLIPNLMETVKGYMTHEKEVLEKVTQLRNLNYNAMSNNEKMDVNNKLTLGLSSLIATAENYPDLKANESFNGLAQELSNVEEDIANSRRYYNGTVREYNTYIQMFPTCMFASMFGFMAEKLFEINETERQNVSIKF